MRLIRVPLCAYCGSGGKVEHDGLTDKLFGVPGKWSVQRCPKCRLAWADPQPIADDVGQLYEKYYTHESSGADAQLSSRKKRLLKRAIALGLPWRRHALRSDGRYLAHLRPGRLLDVGCGSGGYLAGMSELGWQVTGVEFDRKAVAAAARLGLDVRLGSLEEQEFAPNSFDAITLSNVIEHLPDPAAAFTELSRVLAPGGRLVMITPNINSLGHRAFGRCWRGLEPPRHLYLFNRMTLRGFAKRAGFKVEACFTVPGHSSGILEASAELSGDHSPIWFIKRRELVSSLLNRDEGEFVVLLATS